MESPQRFVMNNITKRTKCNMTKKEHGGADEKFIRRQQKLIRRIMRNTLVERLLARFGLCRPTDLAGSDLALAEREAMCFQCLMRLNQIETVGFEVDYLRTELETARHECELSRRMHVMGHPDPGLRHLVDEAESAYKARLADWKKLLREYTDGIALI